MKRRYRNPRRDARTGFSIFIIIIILAVAAGYAGTKYIIFPYLLGSDTAEESSLPGEDTTTTGSGVDVIPSSPSIIIDQRNLQNEAAEIKDNSGNSGAVSGEPGPFCVQFGSFSSKEGAGKLSDELAQKGIYSYVYESGGSYKVLGLPYTTKEKAREAADIVSAAVSDVFVVDLSNLIP